MKATCFGGTTIHPDIPAAAERVSSGARSLVGKAVQKVVAGLSRSSAAPPVAVLRLPSLLALGFYSNLPEPVLGQAEASEVLDGAATPRSAEPRWSEASDGFARTTVLAVHARRPESAPPRRPASGGADTRRRGGLRVLVADDNQVNRRVVEKILQRAGHRATLVANGEEALDALAADHFDVALMDVNMPVLDGVEATKLHRFASLGGRHVPIIGLTADASPATAERCREAGMDACLTKPVEPARLAEAVEAHARPEEGGAGRGAPPQAEELGDAAPPGANDN